VVQIYLQIIEIDRVLKNYIIR